MGTTVIQPIDASAGSPAYSAQDERRGFAALLGGGSGRQLGARPGFRPGTPGDIIAVTSTTWTAQKEFAAVLDPAASTTQGPYRYAYNPLPSADSGAITAADATNPRLDIIVVRVDDASSGDGSGGRQAPLVYRAGVPAATPVAPALGAREFLVGTISVPKVGAGSPTFTLNNQVAVAAGAPQPVWSQTERDACLVYDGFRVERMDLGGRIERYSSSEGKFIGPFRHEEYTFGANNPPNNTAWGPGTGILDAANSEYSGFGSWPANDVFQPSQAGLYALDWAITQPNAGAAPFFMAVNRKATNTRIAAHQWSAAFEFDFSVPNVRLAANEQIQFIFVQTSGATITGTPGVTHRIRVSKVG